MIKLDNNFRIESDQLNVILIQEENKGINKKIGKEIISVNNYYYPNISTALKAYCDKSLANCDSINEITARIDDLKSFIDNKLAL